MNHEGTPRDELAREANRVRSKLLRTVEQLDRRRHEALDLHLQIRRHLRQVVALGALLVLAAAGAVALIAHRVSTASQRRQRNRWRLAKRVWWHPERLTGGEGRSFFGELARSALLVLASTAVTVPARSAVRLLLHAAPKAEDADAPPANPGNRLAAR